MNLLLIAGHGAGDPGATSNGYQEAVETRRVVQALAGVLKDYCNVSQLSLIHISEPTRH